MTQAELQPLSEGLRNSGAVKVYTPTRLLTASVSECNLPDEFVHGDITYRIHALDSDWMDEAGYYKYIATRVDR